MNIKAAVELGFEYDPAIRVLFRGHEILLAGNQGWVLYGPGGTTSGSGEDSLQEALTPYNGGVQ